MPPKRKPTSSSILSDTTTSSTTNSTRATTSTTASIQTDVDSEPSKKKLKTSNSISTTFDSVTPYLPPATTTVSGPTNPNPITPISIPILPIAPSVPLVCPYDGKCYRKNPTHFVESLHPKQFPDGYPAPQAKPQLPVKSKPSTTKTGYGSSSSTSSSSSSTSSSTSSDSEYLDKKKTTKKTSKKSTDKKPSKKAEKKVGKKADKKTDKKAAAAADKKVEKKVDKNAKSDNVDDNNCHKPVTRSDKKQMEKKSSLIDITQDQDIRAALVFYRSFLQASLVGNCTISVDVKRVLQKHRNENGIKIEEHNQLLGQFGWTPDEYELGEKAKEEVDLEEERIVLSDPEGFKIIDITAKHPLGSASEVVWAKASAKFFQTMKKAQANYTIEKIGVIVNTKLRRNFEQKRAEYLKISDKKANINWGFHGSTPQSILAIAKEGFKHPDDLKKGKKKVKLLDEGFFGKGIYFSLYSDYAMWYSEERGSNQVLLCSLLPGDTFQCSDRMDGQGREPGFDSHYSPKGNEIILFEASQILPRYIITFSQQEAQEREQED